MATSGTLSRNFLVQIPGEQGRNVLGGRLTLADGIAYLRTPFLVVDVVNANLESKPGVPTESPIVDVYTESGSQWVRITCGDRDGDVVHLTIWGRL